MAFLRLQLQLTEPARMVRLCLLLDLRPLRGTETVLGTAALIVVVPLLFP